MSAEGIEGEARLAKRNFVLLVFGKVDDVAVREFFGEVISVSSKECCSLQLVQKSVYLCGDLANVREFDQDINAAKRVFIVEQLSQGYSKDAPWPIVDVGQVPLDTHGVGVFYRRYFNPTTDFFNQIRAEHVFQSLTESNKPGTAHREGIYLTPVRKEGDDLHFHLLRCSTNLSGPTDNFRATDQHIVDALNQDAACLFENQASLNHVLAQIYWNTSASQGQKQSKAKIKAHADKTKDMPVNGIMAFCTFYDGLLDKLHPMKDNPFDCGYKTIGGKIKTSGLTSLHFRLKKCVAERPGCSYKEEFSVPLYPESVFFMPLSTNRLYTHEIRPSALQAEQLPTRLGYVVRCSETNAVHRKGKTYFDRGNGKLEEMEPCNPEGMAELRKMYALENRTDEIIHYGQKFPFSMNMGDYTRPKHDVVLATKE